MKRSSKSNSGVAEVEPATTVSGSQQPAAWRKAWDWRGRAPLDEDPSCLLLPSSAASVWGAADRVSWESFDLKKSKRAT